MYRFCWIAAFGGFLIVRGVFRWLDHLKMTKRAAALFLCGALLLAGGSAAYYKTTHFSSAVWKRLDSDTRYPLANDLVQSRQLYGMSKNEVLDMLGEPDWDSPSPDNLVYHMPTGFVDYFLAIHCDPDTKEVYQVEFYLRS